VRAGRRVRPPAKGHIRISYAAATEKLTEALRRIGEFMEEIR
jgi:aspartate/methionine/tyrosine aminotransferase